LWVQMLNFGEIFSETHIVANTRSWSFIMEKLQWNGFSISSDIKLWYNMLWDLKGQAKWLKEHMPGVDNGRQQQLPFKWLTPMTTGQVCCQTHWH
jgi:hypothetical protein